MSQTAVFITKLESLKEGDLARLRRHAGQAIDAGLPGFDLFTGLWWPLRERSAQAPRRAPSWLVAKLYATYRLPTQRAQWAELPTILGRLERREKDRARFSRFDALLQSPFAGLEPHLRWALSAAATEPALDWVKLLDDLSIWDRGEAHRRLRDVRDEWAEAYLNAARPQGADHAD